MKQIRMIIFMIALMCPAGVSAKIYQYVDKNGMVTFTNDLSTIPADKISGALKYDEIQHDDSIPPVKLPSSVSTPLPSENKTYQKEALKKRKPLKKNTALFLKKNKPLIIIKVFKREEQKENIRTGLISRHLLRKRGR